MALEVLGARVERLRQVEAAGRSGGAAPRLDRSRDDDGRRRETLGEAAGDEADDADRPVAEDHDGAWVAAGRRLGCRLDGLGEHVAGQRAALLVGSLEERRQRLRLGR